MNQPTQTNFRLITEAIEFIQLNFKAQPTLNEIAEHVHLSPFHFQRLFTEWAGVSPKKFLQYISLSYAKELLKNQKASVLHAAHEAGLSGTGRLHDLFVNIEGMSPGEYKNGGKELSIFFSFASTRFGDMIVASTHKGICYMAFCLTEADALVELKSQFPNAYYQHGVDIHQQNALRIFDQHSCELPLLKMHLKGTQFQLKVWEMLLKIPMGQLMTYGDIAQQVGNAKASRAVGTAIGSNPVAFLIPCHRVIQATGILGGYRWSPTRKVAIIGWEMANSQH